MAVIQCPNKHYYDDSKFDQCPHCKKAIEKGEDPSKFAENKTVAKFSYGRREEIKEEIRSGASGQSLKEQIKPDQNDQRTVAMFFDDRNVNPVAGWLVGIVGENKGRSFEVHMGKNFVGRSMKMDIHINDPQVSRENHCSVIFEPNACEFYVLQGEGITYHNDSILADAKVLADGDNIEIGGSKYIFVPYCKEGRNWNE